MFTFDGFQLFDYRCCVLPLIEFVRIGDFLVDSIEYRLTDFAYLRLGGVD